MINALALSECRTLQGLSQRQLGKLVGLNFQVIRRLEAGGEAGNLTLRDLDNLCRALAITQLQLLSEPVRPDPTGLSPEDTITELDLAQARLLRRIQRGHEIRRHLTAQEQQLILPTLIKNGLITTASGGRLVLTPRATQDLGQPAEAPTA